MTQLLTVGVRSGLRQRIGPLILLAMVGIGAAACGSSGGSGSAGANSGGTGGQHSTTTSAPAKSGGAGF